MKKARTKKGDSLERRRMAAYSQTRTMLLVVVCFLIGVGAGAYWYHRASQPQVTQTDGTISPLSESTRLILKELGSTVQIRFYSLLDPATTSEALREFSVRADQLLSAYEDEARGKIRIVRQTTRSGAAEQAASTDGIKVFNLDKGEACFLGVALTSNGQKEILSQLSPDWEAALESDLSRAIARVAAPKHATPSRVVSPAPVDHGAVAAVKREIPNLESVSLAEALQTLRVAALKELTEATEAMDRAVKEAEQRVQQAQSAGSEADQQAAVKHLQQVQAEHTAKLKDIAARLQNRIEALQQIKEK